MKLRYVLLGILSMCCITSMATARIATVKYTAELTNNFSTGPCVGLVEVGDLIEGTIDYDDSVADFAPVAAEGRFLDAVKMFDFEVGMLSVSMDASNFIINSIDASLQANEKLLMYMINPESIGIPAGPNLTISAFIFQLVNSGPDVFRNPNELAGISSIYSNFDRSNLSRMDIVGSCQMPDDPTTTGIFGFEAEIRNVMMVPEQQSWLLALGCTWGAALLSRRFR